MEDFFELDGLLSAEEKLAQNTIRKFVDAEVMPVIGQAFEAGNFPLDFIERLAELRVLGMSLPTSHGGLGVNPCAYGLVCQELERGDSGLRSFVSVQNALVIFPIFQFGSDAQQKKYLPKLINGDMIGCFGLTEPGSGSDPSSMTTHAKKVEGGYRLSGAKAWITNAPLADIAIVWAKTSDGIRGFIVERDFDGFVVHETKHKLSMRASSTGELVFDECFVPEENMLPKSTIGLAAALQCLSEARFGIAFGATGAARHCYEIALDYAVKRTQFNKPIASCQLVQRDLVHMLESIVKSQLMNIHLARRKERGHAHFSMISMAKMSNTREALTVARLARNILGANGISLEYQVIRHMVNLETLFTYEGTDNIHQLIIGKHITGLDAF
jgi:glutaryl-CoA dehydrogenase